MIRALKNNFFLIILCILLVGCAGDTTLPAQPNNLCSIFKEKPNWYKAAKKSQKKWGTPMQVMMAIMFQESSFRHDAKPPRPWFLFIPLPRNSSAYGYAQAQDAVWDEYLEETGGWFTSRTDFSDAIDFIGWYNHKSHKINKVSLWRADLLYLNYHEGWAGYRHGRWKSKEWLRQVAKKVRWRASEYGEQLRHCRL